MHPCSRLDRLRMLNSYFVYSFKLKGSRGFLAYTKTYEASQANIGSHPSLTVHPSGGNIRNK